MSSRIGRRIRLRALARWMNRQTHSRVPVTSALLDCFEAAMDDRQIAYLLRFEDRSLTRAEAAALWTGGADGFEPFFHELLHAGFVALRRDDAGDAHYHLASIFPGWIEVYVSDGEVSPAKIEFARTLHRFFASYQRLNVAPVRALANLAYGPMTSPHQTVAGAGIDVEPGGRVRDLIEDRGARGELAVMHCLCRHWHSMIGEPCRQELPSETCLIAGVHAEQVVAYDVGRAVDRVEALELLAECAEKGAVHTVFHDRNDAALPEIAVCNCCWDCCGLFGSYNRGVMPAHVHARFKVVVAVPDRCRGCGSCEPICPTAAIRVADRAMTLRPERCVGCGQCVRTCPRGVLALEEEERDVVLPMLSRKEARLR